MVDNFFKYVRLNRKNNRLHQIEFNYVFGNGEKNARTKPYIYEDYEFYYEDIVNNAGYIEQIVIETLAQNEELKREFEENLIILETKENYFLIYLSRSHSKTFRLRKEFISYEQFSVIVKTSLEENNRKIIYCLYYKEDKEIFKVFYYDIEFNKDKQKPLIKEYTIEEVKEPEILYSKSLQLKSQLKNYKNLAIASLLIIGFISFNELYLQKKIDNFISLNLAVQKIKNKKIKKEQKKVGRELKRYTLLEKKTKIEVINLNKIVDFKKNYKKELKKLI